MKICPKFRLKTNKIEQITWFRPEVVWKFYRVIGQILHENLPQILWKIGKIRQILFISAQK